MARSVNDEFVKRGNTYSSLPEDVILDWKKNGRSEDAPDPAEVERKRKSLEEHGQLMPVIFSLTHDKRLEIEAGFYRCLGMIEVNKTRSPEKRMRLEGVVKDGNPEDMFLKNIAENRDRKETGPIDDAYNVRRLGEKYGKSDLQICEIYGTEFDAVTGTIKPMSSSWLENMRKLLRLPKELQDKIKRGELSASTGYMLADIDPAKRDAVLATAVEDGKPATTTKLVRAARAARALGTTAGLRSAEERVAWTYLKDNDKSTKVRKLAATILLWRAGQLPEPEFFGELHKMLG